MVQPSMLCLGLSHCPLLDTLDVQHIPQLSLPAPAEQPAADTGKDASEQRGAEGSSEGCAAMRTSSSGEGDGEAGEAEAGQGGGAGEDCVMGGAPAGGVALPRVRNLLVCSRECGICFRH